MTHRSIAPIVAAVLVVGLLLGVSGVIVAARERAYPPAAVDRDTLYVTSGPLMRRLTAGYNALAADLYWIRAIQYFGEIRLKNTSAAGPVAVGDYSQLYPLLDLATTLDPHFRIAYRFGSIFLGEPAPGGAGRPDLAIKLLEKGLHESPDRWEYAEDIGFVHYWWRHDYREAATWFDRASKVPNAPWWLKSLSATTLAAGGDRESSRQMWQAIHETADNDWLRSSSERALRQLLALDQIDRLQPIVDRFRETTGRSLAAGSRVTVDGRVVVDPTGEPYTIDASGRVTPGPTSTLLPLPDASGRRTSPVS